MAITQHLLSVEQGQLPLTIARDNRDGAAIVIMPSAFGIGADLQAQMQELTTEASLVVALDPFFREDAGVVPYDDMGRVMARLKTFDYSRGYRDLGAGIDWARSQEGVRSIIVLGVCFGGPYALLAAADGIANGVVTWHGTKLENNLARAAQMRCPMRLHFGGADPFVPMTAVEAVRAAFTAHDEANIIVHDGATHGFSHRGSPRSYDAQAEQAGMNSLRQLVVNLGYTSKV